MSRLDREPDISPSEDNALLSRGFKLINKLGEGSYANVYLCQYSKDETQARIACKVMDTTKASRRFVEKFLPRELDILLKINHPHIIHVHSILKRHNRVYIFMRFAERGDVLEYVSKHGSVTERQARVWFRQLVLALQYLHELDIAHRDLKCENLLLTANYNIKLADFGFSRRVAGPNDFSDTYCGSLSYSAPEVLKGSPYNPKCADIWACGIILFILVNRCMPFDDTNPQRLLRSQLRRCWWFRSRVERILSKELKDFLPLLLEPNAAKRPTIDKLTRSNWIAMEPDLLKLTPGEADALAKAIEEKKRLATAREEQIQFEGNSGKVDEELQDTENAPQENTPSPKASNKSAGHKKLKTRTVCELKPVEPKTDLLPAGSVQHKYPWQKGKREQTFVGDGNLIIAEPVVVNDIHRE